VRLLNRKLLFLSIAFLLASCDSRNPVEQYGDSVVKGYRNAERVGSKTSVQNLQESIKAFHAAYERYPADLRELSAFAGTTLDENTYQYDPVKGVITAKEK